MEKLTQKDLNSLYQKAERLRRLLCMKIESLPQNDNIKIISESPKIFILNSSNLSSTSWTPQYYDFKSQYKFISEVLVKIHHTKISDTISHMIKKGWVTKRGDSYWRSQEGLRLHPDVVEHLKTLLNDFQR